MMALQLKNGDAAYYQSAEYCRNYTSPPVSYGDSSHYHLTRLPGKERLCHTGSLPPLTVSFCANVQRDGENLTSLQMRKEETGCPGAAAVIIIVSCRGLQQPHHTVIQLMDAAMQNQRLSRDTLMVSELQGDSRFEL